MSKFVPNPLLLPQLAVSPGLGKAIRIGTELVLREAQANAPVFAGDYRDGLRVELTVDNGRVVGRVIADDKTGAGGLIEFGTIDTPTFAPLRRALEAVFGSGAVTER